MGNVADYAITTLLLCVFSVIIHSDIALFHWVLNNYIPVVSGVYGLCGSSPGGALAVCTFLSYFDDE